MDDLDIDVKNIEDNGLRFHSLLRAPLRRHSTTPHGCDPTAMECMTKRSISSPETSHNKEIYHTDADHDLVTFTQGHTDVLPDSRRAETQWDSGKEFDLSSYDINAQIHREILLSPYATYRRGHKRLHKFNTHEDDGNLEKEKMYQRRASEPEQYSHLRETFIDTGYTPINIYATHRRAPRKYPHLDLQTAHNDSNLMPTADFKTTFGREVRPQSNNLRSIDLINRNVLIELETEKETKQHKPVEQQNSIKHLFNIKLHSIKKHPANMANGKETPQTAISGIKEKCRGILKPTKQEIDTNESVKEINIDKDEGEDRVTDETLDHKHKEPLFYCKWITKYPKTSFILTFSGHFIIAMVTVVLLLSDYDLFPTDFETLPMSDWNVPWRKRDFAWRFRNDYEDRYVRKWFIQGIDKWYRSMAYGRANMVLYYDTGGGGNIFEKSKLKAMQNIENQLLKMPYYEKFCVQTLTMKCQKPTSILRFFDGTHAYIDPVFNDPEFTNIPKVLHTAKTNNRTKGEFAFFLSRNHEISTPYTYAEVTRTIIPMGYPLMLGQKREPMENEMENFLVNYFKPSVESLKENTTEFQLVYFSYLLFRHEIVRQIVYDMMLALGSILFIFMFIVYHTKSLWISTLAVLSILTSFLGANMIYRIVLDFRYFGFFHVIAIFIILGIGADDLFVFLDVWKNTGFAKYPSLAHRLSDAFKQSVLSMFFTSLTTTVAFFASASSPLLAPKSFGVFAGILVIVNYISVVLYFPTVVIVHHIYFKNWTWPCAKFVKETSAFLKERIKNNNQYKIKEGKQHCPRRTSLYDDNTAVGSAGNVYPVVGETNPAFRPDIEDDYGFIRFKFTNNGGDHAKSVNGETPSVTTLVPLQATYGAMQASDIQDQVSSSVTDHSRETVDNTKLNKNQKTTKKKKKILVRFFRDYYFKFVTHWLIRWIIVAVLLAAVIFFSYCASTLETENEQVQFYRKSHNYGKALDLDFHGFVANKADRNVVVYIVWGLKERDMSSCHFSDGRCMGVERYDKSFNPHSPEAQLALKKFCDRLKNFTSQEIDHFKIRRDFTSGIPEIKCFADSLSKFLQTESRATGADLSLPWDYRKTISFMQSKSQFYNTDSFNKSFTDFLEIPISYWLNDGYRLKDKTDFNTYHTLIGEGISPYSTPLKTDFSLFYGNRIMFLGIQVNLTLGTFSSGYPEGKPALDRWEGFVQDMMKEMPPGMQNGFQLTKDFWHSVSVQKTMADNAIFGILVGILLAFPILTIATQNVVIGFFATFSMCCSTICVIGVIPLVGWKLGILESLNMCMVVGLTVDYVVHLAEGYHMSTHTDRKSRVQDMLEVVGISVFSGACTTLGASLFMFFAQIQFIIRFGIFMFCTIGFSLLYSLGLFTTLMGILGPSGNTGDLKHIYTMVLNKCGRKSFFSRRQTSIEEHLQ